MTSKRTLGFAVPAMFLAGVLIGGVLHGCTMRPPPQAQATTPASSNPTYEVSLLFVHDGYKVYRFYDEGRPHYFVVPNAAPAEMMTKSTHNCGKGCTYEDIIPSIPAKE